MKNKFWTPMAYAATLIAGILCGWMLRNEHHGGGMPGSSKLLNVLNLIHENYVEDISIDSLVEMTIPQLLSNLDPHSSYLRGEELKNANNELDGKFSGIGISFQIFSDTLNVIEVINDGPSERAGIMPGDRIIEVDGKGIAGTGITEDDVFALLRGPKGTQVQLKIKRSNSAKPLSFEITRDDIPVESVDSYYMLNDSTGYVKVSRFGRNTYEEFLQALNILRLSGADNYVVDLRNNGGGFLETAALMANEFLPPGRLIVSTKGRDPMADQVILSDGTGAFRHSGVVVLINEFSASASEIFAGAMQDNDRGWIVGRRSFGKGLVQSPITLPDSSQIRLTIQHYYTPSGRCIQKDYKPGDNTDYELEVINRYNSGEMLSADSVKLNIDEKYTTTGGRTVYGGGGIMPDYFVPNDTNNITSYYVNVVNHNLPMRYAYIYFDDNRTTLEKADNVDELLRLLPPDYVLLQDFVRFAASNGVPARWYYINISSPLIVNQLKALIARNLFGMSAYYEIINRTDNTVLEGLRHASMPILAPEGDE